MNNTFDSVVSKIEKDINKELLSLIKNKDISEHLYTKLRSTGSQPARLYGLAKIHKETYHCALFYPYLEDHMRTLSKKFGQNFVQIEGVNIETNTLEAREIIEKVELDSDENIISFDVKSLNTNVPLKEAMDIALRKLHEQEKHPYYEEIA